MIILTIFVMNVINSLIQNSVQIKNSKKTFQLNMNLQH